MVQVALFVRLEAKPGKESEVASFLRGGLSIVQGEPATTAWFSMPSIAAAFSHWRLRSRFSCAACKLRGALGGS